MAFERKVLTEPLGIKQKENNEILIFPSIFKFFFLVLIILIAIARCLHIRSLNNEIDLRNEQQITASKHNIIGRI